MAQFVDNLVITLSLQAGKFTAGVKDIARELGSLDKNIKQSGDRLQLFGSTVANAFAAGAIARGIKSTIDANAQLVNQIATAEQVFGDGFEAIDKFSDAAVESVGLSKRAAIEAATFLGGLGKAAGIAEDDLAAFSTDLVKLAADLSAAFNTSVQDAVAAIQSGFSGSSIEPLRRYNIVLNDTILKQEYMAITGEKVTGVLSQQQRMVAFLSALYKQSADYQGQWNRESDQALAAQQKLSAEFENMKAVVGGALVPAFTTAVHAVQGLVGAFNALPPSVQQFASMMGIAAVAAVGANKAITAAENALLGFGVSARSVGRIGSTLRTGFLALDAALVLYGIHAARVEANNKKLADSMDELAGLRGQEALDFFTNRFTVMEIMSGKADTLGESFDILARDALQSAIIIRDAYKADPNALVQLDMLNGKIGDLDLTYERMDKAIADQLIKLANQEDATGEVNTQIEQLLGNTSGVADAQKIVNDAIDQTVTLFDQTATKIADMADAWDEYEDSVKDARDTTRLALAQFSVDKVAAMGEALSDALAGRATGVTILDNLAALQVGMEDLFQIIRRNGDEIPDIFDLGSERSANFRSAISDLKSMVDTELMTAFETSGGSIKRYRERLAELRLQITKGLGAMTGIDIDVPENQAKINALLDQILPTDAEIEVQVTLAAKARNTLQAQIATEFLKGAVPTVAAQLEIDLATGKKSPREVIATAQEIADNLDLGIQFHLVARKQEKKFVDEDLEKFATKERDAIRLGVEVKDLPKVSRNLTNFILHGEDKKGWPKIGLATEPTQTAEDVNAMLDPIVPDRIDIPVALVPDTGLPTSPEEVFGLPGRSSGTRMIGGTTVNATRMLGGAPSPYGFTMRTAPIIIQTHINAGVVGDPFAVMRAVEKATRRNVRLMPIRP